MPKLCQKKSADLHQEMGEQKIDSREEEKETEPCEREAQCIPS